MKVKAEAIDKSKMPVISNEPVPTIFCEGFQGVTFSEHLVKINLTDERMPGNEGEIFRYVVARLVMPADAFINFVDVLVTVKAEAVKQLQQHQDAAKKAD